MKTEKWQAIKGFFFQGLVIFSCMIFFLKLVLTRGKQVIENKYSFQTIISKLHHRTAKNHTL